MGHEELKEIGINAYGHRHKLIKGVERLLGGQQGESLKSCCVKISSNFSSNSESLYVTEIFQGGPEIMNYLSEIFSMVCF